MRLQWLQFSQAQQTQAFPQLAQPDFSKNFSDLEKINQSRKPKNLMTMVVIALQMERKMAKVSDNIKIYLIRKQTGNDKLQI